MKSSLIEPKISPVGKCAPCFCRYRKLHFAGIFPVESPRIKIVSRTEIYYYFFPSSVVMKIRQLSLEVSAISFLFSPRIHRPEMTYMFFSGQDKRKYEINVPSPLGKFLPLVELTSKVFFPSSTTTTI